jgi:hypothetical protein
VVELFLFAASFLSPSLKGKKDSRQLIAITPGVVTRFQSLQFHISLAYITRVCLIGGSDDVAMDENKQKS